MDIDINDFIVDKSKQEKGRPPSEGYDSKGNSIEVESDSCVAASSGGYYYVKTCTDGIRAGRFFDPKIDNKSELTMHSKINGRQRYEFRKVSKLSFDHYVAYLTNGIPAILIQAERNIINGY